MVRETSIRFEWLRSKFSNVTDADSKRCIQCVVRAYLLYLVGCILFSYKTGMRVFIEYLKLFEDLGQVSSSAWGVVALANLYRQLGYASRGGVKQIAGYLSHVNVLLKLLYDYLNILYEFAQCDLISMYGSMSTFPACVPLII